jgi:hypothetical protein
MTTTTASVAHRVGRAAIIRPFSFAKRMPFMLTALASSGNPQMRAPNKFLFDMRSLPHLKPHLRFVGKRIAPFGPVALVGILHGQACAPMPDANTQLCA